MALENQSDKATSRRKNQKKGWHSNKIKLRKKIEAVTVKTKENEATGNYKERGRSSVGEMKRQCRDNLDFHI